MTDDRRAKTSGLPGVKGPRDDVALIDAMLLWDDNYGDRAGSYRAPLIFDHGAQRGDPTAFDNATGACFDHWRGKTDDARMVELLRDAWMAVVRDRVDPAEMHEAVLAVPEFRALLPKGELPPCYREDD